MAAASPTFYPNPYYTDFGGGSGNQFKHIFIGSERILTKKTRIAPDRKHWYYHPDHLGSTAMVTNQNSQMVDAVHYFPFGEVWFEEVPSALSAGDYFFTAKEFDPETGFYDFGARYLDPRFSKWMTADPADRIEAGAPITLNPYQYGRHSPARFFDPTGAAEFEVNTARAPELQAWLGRAVESGRWPSSGERIGKAVSLGMISPQAAMDITEDYGPRFSYNGGRDSLDLSVEFGEISPKAALMELQRKSRRRPGYYWPTVAAVFWNNLSFRKRLQKDPQYAPSLATFRWAAHHEAAARAAYAADVLCWLAEAVTQPDEHAVAKVARAARAAVKERQKSEALRAFGASG